MISSHRTPPTQTAGQESPSTGEGRGLKHQQPDQEKTHVSFLPPEEQQVRPNQQVLTARIPRLIPISALTSHAHVSAPAAEPNPIDIALGQKDVEQAISQAMYLSYAKPEVMPSQLRAGLKASHKTLFQHVLHQSYDEKNYGDYGVPLALELTNYGLLEHDERGMLENMKRHICSEDKVTDQLKAALVVHRYTG